MKAEDQIKEIKTQLRLYMNGVAAQSMREKGIEYKVNFGVELPRLKEIASCYEKDHSLAQALWKENVREYKILAGMLQPVETFFPEIADIWVEDIRYPDMAELTCMNLFQYLPYASVKAFEWMADDREYFETCGFLLISRLLGKGLQLNERAQDEFLDQAITALHSEKLHPRKAAALALKNFGLQSSGNAHTVLRSIRSYVGSENQILRALCEEIKLELEYLL